MRALTYSASKDTSDAPLLEHVELSIPQPGQGEVLVRVQYAALSYIDYQTMRGDRNKAIVKALEKSPVVSGIEMAGVVESDGMRFKKGDQVVGYTNIFKGPWFHAEYVAHTESRLTLLPDGISPEGATSIIGGALTSITALERIAGLKTGQHVLITGATGSVGVTAVQLATHRGAETTAVCHSSQAEFAQEKGALSVFAYDRGELPAAANQFDVVFDAAPSLSFALASPFMTPRGCYITTMPHLDKMGFLRALCSRRKWGFLMEADTDEKRLGRLRELMAEGAFDPAVDSIFPVAEAEKAFSRQQETGKRGKILIEFP